MTDERVFHALRKRGKTVAAICRALNGAPSPFVTKALYRLVDAGQATVAMEARVLIFRKL